MQRTVEPIRILADVMNYLDQAYCRGSIVEWVRTAPEGAAYSIVRQLFVRAVEESGRPGSMLRAA